MKNDVQTRYDHFNYLIMLFDFVNVSIIFQIYINKILIEIINIFCIVYLNDILIFSKNKKKHVIHIRDVLQRFRKFELYANLKKCNFFIKKIKYLNFIINIDNITINSRRIKIIQNWSTLKFFKNIQIFLKFVNFYQRFIHWYSQIIIFLINFFKNMQIDVKKKIFVINFDVVATFNFFREIFQKISILIHFNFIFLLRLKTDASNFEIFEILSQLQFNDVWKFIAFYSRKMIFAEQNYEIHDQKLLIIVICFKNWRHCFKNNYHFIKILINHNNFKKFMNIQILNNRQIKWIIKLIAFNFKIKYQSKKLILSTNFQNNQITKM